jgi:hypothetical protein
MLPDCVHKKKRRWAADRHAGHTTACGVLFKQPPAAGIGWQSRLVTSGIALRALRSVAAAANSQRGAVSTHYMAVGGAA